MLAAVPLAALHLALTGCAAAPEAPPPEAPRALHLARRWDVQSGREVVGRLVLLETRDAGAPLRFYRVENARGQWVGFVDVAGRVWRRVPFRDDEFLGMHPMESALALLYDLPAPPAIVPQPATEDGTGPASPPSIDPRSGGAREAAAAGRTR